MRLFDLILEDGTYWVHCPAPSIPVLWQGKPVANTLEIKGIYRVPFLGSLMRNFWAKSHGARLQHVHHGVRMGVGES